MYKIIRCLECGTLQYIRDDQVTRSCPRCRYKIKCKSAKVFARADSEREASEIVRSMKTPGEITQRMSHLKSVLHKSSTGKNNLYPALGKIITQLLSVFPNAMPQSILISKAKEMLICENDIEILDILDKLNKEGLMLINKDFNNNIILKFPSLPFTYGKIHVSKPNTKVQFNKQVSRSKYQAKLKNKKD
jgi:hypothetical protein